MHPHILANDNKYTNKISITHIHMYNGNELQAREEDSTKFYSLSCMRWIWTVEPDLQIEMSAYDFNTINILHTVYKSDGRDKIYLEKKKKKKNIKWLQSASVQSCFFFVVPTLTDIISLDPCFLIKFVSRAVCLSIQYATTSMISSGCNAYLI